MSERPRSVLLGIARLARGRADGIEQFGGTPQAFMASLAPLIAFPLVASAWLLLNGSVGEAVLGLLASLVALLGPPVISHALARGWGREAAWLRYAVAFNWCQWAIPLAAVALLLSLRLLAGFGLPAPAAANAFVLGLAGYATWLHWFIARHGLALSRLRALAVSLLVNIGTVLLAAGPRLLLSAIAA